MLIGGPNQSYNVNFKELPLIEGKDFNQAVFEFGRQLFFKGISKNVQTDRTKNDFQKTSPPSESANCFSGGRPNDGNQSAVIKQFSQISFVESTSCC